MLASGAGAAGTLPGRLESVSILAAGADSSVAVRTSTLATLVATTAEDARTVVIELVGIASDRRDMTVADAAGLISRIAVDTVGQTGTGAVTRIRVSLARPCRHRVRTSGNVVYVDFERVEAPNVNVVARRQPVISKRPAAQVPADKPPARPAAVPETAIVKASRPPAEVNLLGRWLAITEPLQHTFTPPSAAAVLGRAWIPLVLTNGTTIFSYGDYAEVDEQITFLLPFDDNDAPRVEAVSLPKTTIDLTATARAAEPVRAARYMLTRGPREFADLSQEVSAVLNAVPLEVDPVARVNLVEMVRRRLIEWPEAHYGYRARDINVAVSMLDPILSQLRAAAGVKRVDLSLVAPTNAPSPTITFRQPTLIDLIENAMRFVSVLTVPAERTAVLRATAESLERHRAELPAVWFTSGQRRVAAALKSETRVDEAYGKLSAGIVTRALRAAREGNVRAIAALQLDLMERDRRLGGKRQDVVFSTIAALQTQFEVAAQAQLLRDRRALGVEAVRAYADDIAPALERFGTLEGDLQHVARISTTPSKMQVLREGIEFVKRRLAQCLPPPQVAEAHSLLLTAAHLAGVAVQESVDPLLPADMAISVRTSAAAEALTMFERGRRAIEAPRRER